MTRQRYTAEQVTDALRLTKGMVSLAAQRLGCDPDTVHNYARRYPSVAQTLREERDAMTDVAELSLYRAVQAGEAWAVCFYLKTQGRARGYVERQEVTGAGGGPLQHELSWTEAVQQAWARRPPPETAPRPDGAPTPEEPLAGARWGRTNGHAPGGGADGGAR